MKKYLIGALVLGLANTAVATEGHSQEGGFFGLKAGTMRVDVTDNGLGIDLDDSTNIGFYTGYVGQSGLGFELEYTQPTSKTDTGVPSVKYELRTLALYGTFRSDGNIYLKGKAGYLREDVKFSGPGGSASDKESGMSLGGGVGFMLGSSRLELEYTIIESDVNYLSIGFIF
ncbi:porin family protein [Alcanivorax sp. JB21]|uniref:outer membrane beta-barrel protein n=1 Tax=Alcanivorax limicola TaxID=2874102 RepID=UPI001CBB7B21|nr:outer membrane beta-barrel protein [Alcanivorax limicola]MBZ2189964.1 porin family protein [Alcanivorax limicola]